MLWLHNVIRSPSYLIMLKDEEIWSSYKLLSKKEFDGDSEGVKDPDLVRIIVVTKAVF